MEAEEVGLGKTLTVEEDPVMKHKLNRAVVVEVDAPYDVKQAVNNITGADVPFVSFVLLISH